jgi:hypothetical protein
MVQNGKFSAGTPILVKRLKRVDLPAFGRPTRPTENIKFGENGRKKLENLKKNWINKLVLKLKSQKQSQNSQSIWEKLDKSCIEKLEKIVTTSI